MNLHILHSKLFLKHIRNAFGYTEDDNEYVVLTDSPQKDDFIKEQCMEMTVDELSEYIRNSTFEQLVIHYLDGRKAHAILDSGFVGDIHWSAWGGDIYNSHFGFNPTDLYGKATKEFYIKTGLRKKENILYRSGNTTRKFLLFLYPILKFRKHPYRYVEELIPSLTSCSTVLPFEIDYIRQRCPDIQYKPFSYIDLSSTIKSDLINFDHHNLGDAIVTGTSASPTNNHIDVIKAIGEHRLIIPLAYGNVHYKDQLLSSFQKPSIEFLLELIPYDDYLKLLSSANTMIMNQHRQHGLGNITLGLYLGMRLYLNRNNPSLDFFKSLGIHVFDFESDFKRFENKPLSDEEVRQNRINLESYWGKEATAKRMKNFF
jgi:dTDP-N-acetylfucosamine:lipid II N-acetylfucosaminyltransferase